MSNNNIVLQGGSNTMYQNLKKKSEGFTIIEVLIVLAIAGLIMLIVFLAIPALQRNSRNNARNSDASRIASAMQECLSNRNNQVSGCRPSSVPGAATAIEGLAGTRSQLQDSILYNTGTDVANMSETGSTSQAVVAYGYRCTDDGGSTSTGAHDNDYVVKFRLETASGTFNRCVGNTQ